VLERTNMKGLLQLQVIIFEGEKNPSLLSGGVGRRRHERGLHITNTFKYVFSPEVTNNRMRISTAAGRQAV